MDRKDKATLSAREEEEEKEEEGKKEGRKGRRKEGREDAMQPLLQLANKLLQPQQQPQLQKLASYIHYYPEQNYPARLAHSQGCRGWSRGGGAC